jgi:hypothetical protein
MVRALFARGLFAAVVLVSAPAQADVAWVGDFEDGTLDQWDGALNGRNISVVMDPVAEGAYGARIELTNDAVWPNGLKRVELHHGPDPARTAEGAETYFAWSFYLPETLPADPSQQIGYWESDQSYQQMMAFQVEAEHISFATRRPQNQIHWEQDGVVTPGAWHRIAMRIFWSKDAAQGEVDVWFDGEQVVSGAQAQTLADDNPHFTQVGLLRGAVEFADAPVIMIDDAVEGDTLEDVRPDALSQGTGGGGGGTTSSTSATSSAATTTGAGPSATSGAGAGSGSGAGGADGADDGEGGCRTGGRGDGGALALLAAGVALALVKRRATTGPRGARDR